MNLELSVPELLSIEQLQQCLSRFIPAQELSSVDKTKLIEYAYKYVVPLPQRQFRSNRLGLILSNHQKSVRNRKRLSSIDSERSEKASKINTSPSIEPIRPTISEKHQADRGIYTIHKEKTNPTKSAPIKLKRPVSLSESNDKTVIEKRPKLDEKTD